MVSAGQSQISPLAGDPTRLGARKQLQIKVIDLEQTVRCGFGLNIDDVSRGKLPARIWELAARHVMLGKIVEPLLVAREAMWRELASFRKVLMIIRRTRSPGG